MDKWRAVYIERCTYGSEASIRKPVAEMRQGVGCLAYNVALPQDYEKILSTCRSRAISQSIIIQNVSQLKALFKDSWESVIGNCDSLLYLGGNEKESHKLISDLLGKETISANTYGQTKGRSGSYTTNLQHSGRELLTPDEVRMLDNEKAVLLIRGERPVLDSKYDLMKHPNVQFAEDGGAEPFDYAVTPLAKTDLSFEPERFGDYVIFDCEEFLEEEESAAYI